MVPTVQGPEALSQQVHAVRLTAREHPGVGVGLPDADNLFLGCRLTARQIALWEPCQRSVHGRRGSSLSD